MKIRKWFIILLSVILTLTLLPGATISAAPITDPLDFVNTIKNNSSGDGWTWEKSTKTLTLNDFDLISKNTAQINSRPGILLPDGSTIVLCGNNSININDYGSSIYVNGDLTLQGSGTLTINSGHNGIIAENVVINSGTIIMDIKGSGIAAGKNLSINGGTVSITSSIAGELPESAIVAHNATIHGGMVHIEGEGVGIETWDNITVSGGIIDIVTRSYGISSYDFTISGGILTIESSQDGILGMNTVTLSGGSGTIKTTSVRDEFAAIRSYNGDMTTSIIVGKGISIKGWDGTAYAIPAAVVKCKSLQDTGYLTFANEAKASQILTDIQLGSGSGNDVTNPFLDVKVTDWFYGDVKYAYTEGLMNGTNNIPMLFSPNAGTTRGMFVTILHRHAGSPSVSGSTNSFSDVAANMWYSDAVKWAAANNIVKGIGNNRFAPDDKISRQDLIAIIDRYNKYYQNIFGGSLNVVRPYETFADQDKISDYAKDAMKWAVSNNIIQGENNKLKPKDNATRAEAATIMYRYCELLK